MKKRWWALAVVGVGLAGLMVQIRLAGPPPSPTAADALRDKVTRYSYKVPASAMEVSVLHKGTATGRRIIFVHGTPGDGIEWERYLAAAPPDTEMLALDRPGFGQSRPGRAVVSLSEQADALRPLLINRGGGWPILVGHSYGGSVIAQAATDNPGKVSGLLILAGALDPAQEHTYAIQYAGEWPGIRSILPSSMRNANLELMALKAELEKLAPRLAAIKCRVAVIHGTEDRNVPYANVAFIRSHFTGARLTVDTLPGEDHFLPEKHEGRVKQTIADLLRESGPPC